MSGYSGRHGPNVSQYIANLNTSSPQQDLLADALVAPEEDFTLFTNQNFWDTDTGNFDLEQPLGFSIGTDTGCPSQVNAANHPTTDANGADQNMDFNLTGDFQFADFSQFPSPILHQPMQSLPLSQPHNYPVPPVFSSPVSNSASSTTPGLDHSPGKKRKLDTSGPKSQQAIDEAARIAAEEDKRRRNTAASARFRVKKKQREQALEKSTKDMLDKVAKLEMKVAQLETENSWLKGLITEKNNGKTPTTDVKVILSDHEAVDERNTDSRTDGVGTDAKD